MKKFTEYTKEASKINEEEGSPSFFDLSKASNYSEFHQNLKKSIEDFSRTSIHELNVDMDDTDDWRGYYGAVSEVLGDVINNVDFENL
jgi:hypothetical protein